jgi:hypothetical protein
MVRKCKLRLEEIKIMDEREELIKKLACFGCEYCDDCLDDYDEEAPQCNAMYDKAESFVQDNIDI